MNDLFEIYQKESHEWDDFVNQHIGSDAQLIGISNFSGNRRVYRSGGRIHKIKRPSKEHFVRQNDSQGEYQILRRLTGISGVDLHPQYQEINKWQVLSLDWIEGNSLENRFAAGIKDRTSLDQIKTIIEAVRKKGVAHRDLRPNNVLIDNDGKAHLLDFDQAVVCTPWQAYLADFIGIGKHKGFGSYLYLVRSMHHIVFNNYFANFLIKSVSLAYHVKAKLMNFIKSRRPKKWVPSNTDKELNDNFIKLHQAWELGAKSDANAPWLNICYYSLDLMDYHFPGERAWAFRWTQLSSTINFKGKRLLELGCNLGMLSAFSEKSGGLPGTGVDWDPKILEGASLASQAFQTNTKFIVADFDSREPWEDKLSGFEFVSALSVINWLKDRSRFLQFLGQHREAIYEGHDPLDIEMDRLRSVGFKKIQQIATSERNRAVLYASK